MTDNSTSDDRLRDSEIAIIDALKMLIEIMVASGIAKPDGLQRLFSHQRDGYITKNMPNAAVVMEVLRSFAQPPKPVQNDAHRKALEEPPQGSA